MQDNKFFLNMKNPYFPIISSLIVTGLLLAGASQALASTTLSPCSSCGGDQNQINAALKEGGVVTLNEGTYVLTSSINMRSNTTLKGNGKVVLKVADDVKWERYRPIIHGSSVKNIRIVGIEVDGNRANNTYPPDVRTWGRGFYRQFFCYKCLNVEFDHSYLHDNWDAAFFIEKSGGVNIHDNIVRNPGQDVVSAVHSDTVFVTNNCLRAYGASGVHVWGESGPIYIINNDIAGEAEATNTYAGIYVHGKGSSTYNCNNTIHDMTTPIGLLDGATINTGGCPTSPPVATSASSCKVADLSKPSSTNDYGATANVAKWTSGNVYVLGSGCPNSSRTTSSNSTDPNEPGDEPISGEDDPPQVTGHMVGGFGAYGPDSMAAVKNVGGNTIMNYISITSGLSRAHAALTTYAAQANQRGIKLIDDIPEQLIRRWHSNGNMTQLVDDMTKHVKWLAESEVRGAIAGFWMLDDWYSDFGSAKIPLQKLNALIHEYIPGKPSICGFTGNTSYGGSASGYAPWASNYSPAGCDMVGVYIYPWGAGKVPMTNLPHILQALKNVGWDPSTHPLIGIPQTYGGMYGYDVPTAAQVQSEIKYFCQQGAKHIISYNFNSATNASGNANIRAGFRAGIKDCQSIW